MTLKTTLQKLVGMQTDIAKTAQDLRAGLAAVHEEIAAKRAERERVRAAFPPPEELIANAERVVDEKAQAYLRDYGRTFLEHLAGRSTDPALSGREAPPRRPPTLPPPSPTDPEARECFLDPTGTKDKYRRGILAIPYDAGVASAALGPLLERLDRELTALEAAEEELVDDLIANGISVSHRPEVVARRNAEAQQQQRDAENAEHKRRIAAWQQDGEHPLATHRASMYPDRTRDRR